MALTEATTEDLDYTIQYIEGLLLRKDEPNFSLDREMGMDERASHFRYYNIPHTLVRDGNVEKLLEFTKTLK